MEKTTLRIDHVDLRHICGRTTSRHSGAKPNHKADLTFSIKIDLI